MQQDKMDVLVKYVAYFIAVFGGTVIAISIVDWLLRKTLSTRLSTVVSCVVVPLLYWALRGLSLYCIVASFLWLLIALYLIHKDEKDPRFSPESPSSSPDENGEP